MQNDFNLYLAEERAKNTAEHATVSFLSEVGQAVLTVGLIWKIFPAKQLLLWLVASVVISSIAFRFHKTMTPSMPQFSPQRWQRAVTGSSFCVGFIWGMIPVLFFAPGDITYLAFILALYTGYVSGALAVTFTHQPSFISFTLGITLPFAGRMFYEADVLYSTIGALAIFYVSMLIYVSKNMNSLFIRSTQSQYNNARLLRELAREKEAVEQAVASKDRFLASASHDLRQPLNAISLFVDALGPVQTKPLGHEILDKIRTSLKGLNGMLHSLLDISRLDAKAIDIIPKHVSLTTLVAQLCDEYAAKAGRIEIHNQIDEEIIVFVDPTVLYRVVRNLIDNAVKYTNEGSVTLSASKLDDHISLCIEDTGIGIPSEKIDSVFDEFEQLNNPERNREKGLGLGLAIVKRLCNIAKIGISLHSEYGHGTTVTLKIRSGLGVNIEGDLAIKENDLSGQLVVVIDDEQAILDGMQLVLSSWNCDVIIGESFESVNQLLTQQNKMPDLIISDLRLKDKARGTDVIEAIREEYNSDIPAILVTGDTAPENISEVRASGLSVIYKPVDLHELQTLVIAKIGRR
ncbi:ATP-binding response regulator [Arenicella xantha]|uniref:histidine kinase n=1 Tax=Arenicella xantha TaxID=644221 RepID=A0A395JQ53_9GAMM|nr:hybrid sensor histidine kinase/response regulator [Arenicella xantha]RBP53781.1 signal transduction histidine kinase [Arenicella xantha]